MSDIPTRVVTGSADAPAMPGPTPPDAADAWYAPRVRAQREPHPEVVTTVREDPDGEFTYHVREPSLTATDEERLAALAAAFEGVESDPPLTREGIRERMAAGFESKYDRVVDRHVAGSPAARRRRRYHALRDLRGVGAVTPLALDDGVEVADVAGDRLTVHTRDFAPAETTFAADADGIESVASTRLVSYEVPFAGFSLPVVVYRRRLLGTDSFGARYAVREPDLLPGDRELIAECKDRIWETNVDEVVTDRTAFVRERARRFLRRRLTARDSGIEALLDRARIALGRLGVGSFSPDRLADLVYYVLRDYVGEGQLTVPIRDPHLEDIEANRVGERVKVVPRDDLIEADLGRLPTNLRFDDVREFENVVTQLAAADGTELSASTPSAKVNVEPDDVPDDVTIRCAVALPAISEGGPHVSIRKQAPEAMTPVDLIRGGSLSTELVALLWMAYEHHGVVLFSGPTGVGKTTLMNAHMPFVPFDDRPISIDEGSREVRLPHETGVSLTTRDHEDEFKRGTMADLMTESNYLNPDVEVIAEINTPASFETFAETLNTGHGVIGTTHAEDTEKLVNRVVEQGLPAYLLREIDLVVFPRYADGERYVGEVVEFVPDSADRFDDRGGAIRKDDTRIRWNSIARRETDGSFSVDYASPELGDDDHHVGTHFFESIARRTDRPVETVEREFHRKCRYVTFLVEEGIDGFDALFELTADLATEEAATVDRLRALAHDDGTTARENDDPDGDRGAPETGDETTDRRDRTRRDRDDAERVPRTDGGGP
ncbi:secretion system protein [Halobacteriales archaeon SW_7_68_16]|nr:MAG: secretion system protein [Halobacteriales archaeon SW_7_68_16]